jgi:hypothetical protein
LFIAIREVENMVNEMDLEKVAMLDSIQTMACHEIESEALKNCLLPPIVGKVKDTTQADVSAQLANEMGIPPVRT